MMNEIERVVTPLPGGEPTRFAVVAGSVAVGAALAEPVLAALLRPLLAWPLLVLGTGWLMFKGLRRYAFLKRDPVHPSEIVPFIGVYLAATAAYGGVWTLVWIFTLLLGRGFAALVASLVWGVVLYIGLKMYVWPRFDR